MTSPPSFRRVKEELSELQKTGQQSVDIALILKFIERAELDSPFDGELVKMSHEVELAHQKLHQDGKLEEFRSVIATAKSALSTIILVNGGAAVALLTFIGTLLTKAAQPTAQPAFASSLLSFATGVLLGALATGFTYFAQYCYHAEHNRLGSSFRIFTVLLALGSYAAFFCGVINSYHALIK